MGPGLRPAIAVHCVAPSRDTQNLASPAFPVLFLSVIVPKMSDNIPSAKRARRLPDAIAEYLMAAARELAPGSRLPSENQLARQFGVSRSAVREAVSGVESLGLLQIRKGAGMFVRAPIVGNLEFRGSNQAISRAPRNCWKFAPVSTPPPPASRQIAGQPRSSNFFAK